MIFNLKNRDNKITFMKAKHLFDRNFPLSQRTYDELRKGLRFGRLKWKSIPRKMKNTFHSFEESRRAKGFEKILRKGASKGNNYETPI